VRQDRKSLIDQTDGHADAEAVHAQQRLVLRRGDSIAASLASCASSVCFRLSRGRPAGQIYGPLCVHTLICSIGRRTDGTSVPAAAE